MFLFFFFAAPTPPEIYTLSLHDALPISHPRGRRPGDWRRYARPGHAPYSGDVQSGRARAAAALSPVRSEEHTSELQSRGHLVCRLLLEKKNNKSTSL